jgi:phage recombination protein Bet
MSTELKIWETPQTLSEIKKTFAPNLTETEFSMLVGMGKATGLNPFLREIWAVKYGGKAQLFIGRDGYRKSAQRHKDYGRHTVIAIYSNDQFEATNGVPTHKYSMKDRGELIGAYCLVERKTSTLPMFSDVLLKEYDKKQGVWLSMPETMIKKVAEAQGLRMAFQELFAGTYSEAEDWKNVPEEIFEPLQYVKQLDECTTLHQLHDTLRANYHKHIVNHPEKDSMMKHYESAKKNIIELEKTIESEVVEQSKENIDDKENK